ncbi:related to Cupin domain protein [Rhynchosporium agropyri]|uniref:Related to Cupin domain protein n=1 Tax=Rhynchosporium agropyri TaxID=914238 RepID=A0A1E1LTH1_9HELO|nr:related to Cupin domain protein [Rhynchosporium agropyri]
MSDRPLLPNGLPDVQRLITTHDPSGKAVFSEDLSSESSFREVDLGANFFLGYTTKGFPVDLNADNARTVPKDIQSYEKDLNSPPGGLSIHNGTALRFVDFAPSKEPYMHRTESIDYGVVLEGIMELILDSGQKKIMRRGDVCIQRGTMHAWRNVTENEGWARMLFTLVAAEKLVVGGQDLAENLPGKLGDKSPWQSLT